MNATRAIAGWVLFLLMAVLAAFFWYQSDMRGKHIKELNTRIIEIEAQVNRLTDEIFSITDKISKTEAELQSIHLNEHQNREGNPVAPETTSPALP